VLHDSIDKGNANRKEYLRFLLFAARIPFPRHMIRRAEQRALEELSNMEHVFVYFREIHRPKEKVQIKRYRD